MKKILSALVLSLFLASCATPTVVNVVGPNDGAMTCNQLDTQIAIANKYADDARKEKDMGTGTNISALLFWLPGLWATHKNVEEAVDANRHRANWYACAMTMATESIIFKVDVQVNQGMKAPRGSLE